MKIHCMYIRDHHSVHNLEISCSIMTLLFWCFLPRSVYLRGGTTQVPALSQERSLSLSYKHELVPSFSLLLFISIDLIAS